MVAVNSKQFFVRLNAVEREIADFNRGRVAISQEWTKFVKDETEIQKYCSLFQIESPSPWPMLQERG